MTRYLLDTNIVSDLIRNPHGKVFERVAAIGEDRIATSIIVAGELRFGAAKRRSEALTDRVELLLSRLNVLPLESGLERTYASLRAELESKGTPIGGNDLLIAAHTLFLGQSGDWVLVTANVREFGRVSDLIVESWL